MTIQGEIPASQLGTTLIHEHVLVDFIGADRISASRWDRAEVVAKVLPYLREARERGLKTLLECTPAFLGRDPLLLLELAEQSGLQLLTNTGYYGAVDNKYLPPWAFDETAEQLAQRWTAEFEQGIEGTSVRPGFIKIGVNAGTLSELHRKLVKAAALTHLRTGLTICSHTGPAATALEEIEVLRTHGVAPRAFVWVHAQGEPVKNWYVKAAQLGTWVSLDGLGWGNPEEYVPWIELLKTNGYLSHVLLSHDAGWYRPGEPDGGTFVGYTPLFDRLLPALRKRGFTENDFEQLLVTNPADAFTLRVRKV